jgi:hypothetical protein
MRQRMQVPASNSIMEESALRCMAPVGQAVTQAASLHCWQSMGTEIPSYCQV